ncbi:MAG: AAA family ATPase [Phycisphaeraceae bacterium]
MSNLRSIMGVVAAGAARGGQHRPEEIRPFVTIARQSGAGATTLKDRLVERLRELDTADPPWTGFERELVEKVAKEHQLSQPLVESLGEKTHSWIEDLFTGLTSHGPEQSELTAYRRVAQTIRALAQAGRVVVVGRGGVFLTRDMPRGLHIQLVAPLEQRIAHVMQRDQVAEKEARKHIQQRDHARQQFYKRYWPNRTVTPESFTVTYNTAGIDEDALVDSIIPLIPGLPGGRKQTVAPLATTRPQRYLRDVEVRGREEPRTTRGEPHGGTPGPQ